jgi:predicted DCC family thiol-disulfide oxidoreductase YuxK
MYPLTIFYDSKCPLCVAEMRQLGDLDSCSRLTMVDIHEPEFNRAYPHIDRQAADRILHAQYSNGELIYGLDVTHQAWRAVGRKPWVAILRVRGVRFLADIAYRIFARHRYTISFLLTGQRRCETCEVGKSSQMRSE